MVDREIVLRRIELIREYAGILEELVGLPEASFIQDRDVHLKAERCLEVVIQAMLDIGSHIISDRQLRHPNRYEEVFEILGASGVIGRDLAARLRGLAGLRNILVHLYLEVDRARLRQAIVDGLDQLGAYVREVLAFLDRVEPS